jgi:hypothetical protein
MRLLSLLVCGGFDALNLEGVGAEFMADKVEE